MPSSVSADILSDASPGEAPAANAAARPRFPLLSMCLAMLLVGATAPLGEVALRGMGLPQLLAVRLVLAWAVLRALSPGSGAVPRLEPRHWAVLALQALSGVVVFNACLWLGMEGGGAAAAGVFTSATPAVMVLLGVVLFRELPGLRALGGVGLCVVGVLAARDVFGSGFGSGAAWSPLGSDALLLAAVAGESVFLLALKWLPAWLTPLEAARCITLLGFFMVLPWAVWTFDPAAMFEAGFGAWLAVAALGVLVTAGGYVLWFRGVGSASASQAAVITGLMPVSAVLSSWLLSGAAPSGGQVLGCLAVGLGIWLSAGK
ncbi:DMT family transporter [Fundidesulfovibrio soli]|uniref:DMT family transporter n=1 Tax=Fundidesulfovibrio soli TaxID=2922716 RepID=UPI001FAF2B21|nr:DMT family transporter [Fundidesulfovibrio soli]